MALMNRILFTVYRVLVPKPVRTIIRRKNIRKKILRYYSSLPESDTNDEQREILKFLESNPLVTFPYPFSSDYSTESIEVHFNESNGLHFVIHEGKKLYFKRRWSKKRIKRGYSNLQREQDSRSPHRYLEGDFDVSSYDVIADVGAAEGNFSLSVIDHARKIYIFEYNHDWIEALKATFEPWMDKIEIIEKKVSDINDKYHITLDSFFREHNDITFLKIDVDGAEEKVLHSSKNLLDSRRPLKVALCTYHRNDDEATFTRILNNKGFRVSPSRGYMVYYFDKKMKAPYLRRGLLRAVRE